jgi:hypothetical protein
VRVSLFDHKSVAQIELRYLPLALNADTIVLTFVVHVVLADILLNKCNATIGEPISANGEFSNFITALTLNLVVEDIQVVNDHLVVSIILAVLSAPGLVGTRHEE